MGGFTHGGELWDIYRICKPIRENVYTLPMSIVTKTGDKGETGLLKGRRLPKTDPLFEVIGDLDELSAQLGLTHNNSTERIQNDLFELGALLAGLEGGMIAQLQRIEEELFVLNPPSHSKTSSSRRRTRSRATSLARPFAEERNAISPPLHTARSRSVSPQSPFRLPFWGQKIKSSHANKRGALEKV